MSLRLTKPNLWQVLIAGKVMILIAVWTLMDHGFSFGDLELFAADKAPVEEPAKAGAGAAAPEGKEAKLAANDSGDKAGGKARQSFLANLLELPELHPEAMKKDELGKYLEIAERKKAQIEDRLAGLGRREEQLKGLENSIDDKLKRLDEERRYFAQTLQQEKDLKGERLDKLISMYAKMEPKKAAPVLEKLDKDLVVELFKALPQKQVTAILEVMAPDKSVMISEYYGRVRSTREYDVLKEMNQSLRKEFDDCKGMGKS